VRTRVPSPGRRFVSSRSAFVVAGVLGGIWLGSRSVKTYDWHTEWTIPAPLPIVYEAMTSREAVREWWPDMELVDDSEGDLSVGSTVSFHVHQAPEIARLAPPFQIHCLYTDVEPQRRLRETVEGDLSGVLETLFHEQVAGTSVSFNWYVRVTSPALNLLGYVAERMYRHSHDHVMESGETGLTEYCLRLANTEGARSG
jgi:uncharacterized protein YndB with AHSA1/START domain